MSTQRLAILGGTGFIGHSLCRRLVAAGHTVRVLTRRREQHRDLLVLPTLQLVEADLHDLALLRREFRDVDAVINLVGILNPSRRQSFEQVHAELPARIVQACRESGVRRLLHMCALHASPNAPSAYLRSKARGEKTVLDAESRELHVTSFRPSVVFGPADHFTNRFADLLRKVPLAFPLACAEARMQPVYVEDVVQAFVAALDRAESFGQRYNLCGPEVLTLQEIVTRIAVQAGLRRRIIPLGNTLSRVQAALLQFAPGKPFTPDNFQSLQVASVCDGPFPAFAGVMPSRLDDVLVRYLRA